jgi:3-hydroxyacyl-[acyl-carrier-protein] dehydratase
MNYERTLAIGRDHPALPGHFPGYPVVPGVLVLDEVIETLKEQYRQSVVVITGLPSAKLSSQLFPEEQLTIRVEPEDIETAAFTCRVGNRLIASGSIRFRLVDGSRAGPP